jgi:hypothetical protein
MTDKNLRVWSEYKPGCLGIYRDACCHRRHDVRKNADSEAASESENLLTDDD